MEGVHPAAGKHLPPFITGPGQTDVLFVVMVVFLITAVLLIGVLYFRLHALPERIAHRTNKVQMEIVAVLTLLALFTHNHLFWIAALLLAFVRIPDFSTPISSIARSLERLSGSSDDRREAASQRLEPAAPEAPEEELVDLRKEDLKLVPESEPAGKMEVRG